MIAWVVFVAVAILAAVASYLAGRAGRRAAETPSAGLISADTQHVLDLARRVHEARAAVLVLADGSVAAAMEQTGVDREALERAESLARLALGDGRQHIAPADEGGAVAVGRGDAAVALLLVKATLADDEAARAFEDLQSLATGFHVQVAREAQWTRHPRPSAFTSHHESLDQAAAALCEAAHEATGIPTGVVVRDPITQLARMLQVSSGADRRLVGTTVAPESAAGRASVSGTPVPAGTTQDLLGQERADRRQAEAQGMAFPLTDGRSSFGSLVVFGAPDALDAETREAVLELAADAGPALANLLALKTAEQRAMTDELTGLPNRRELQRAMNGFAGTMASFMILDLDHFKQLNDTHGHIAGDAALKHVSRIMRKGLRERDVPGRMGGEEFGLWLPETPLLAAKEVAERVRAAVARTPFTWAGERIELTCSIGVAAIPETTRSVANLYAVADAALYRAKEAGRNRVEAALSAKR